MTKETCVLYSRISTNHESQLSSLTHQEEGLIRWAEENDMEVLGSFEDTCSGREMECREGLKKAVAMANNTGSTILITSISRLSRSVGDIANLLSSNTKFCITSSGRHLSKEMILIMGIFAENFSDELSKSVSRGIQAKFARDPQAQANWGGSQYRELANSNMTRGRKSKADRYALQYGSEASMLRKQFYTNSRGHSVPTEYQKIAEIYSEKEFYWTPFGKPNWSPAQIRNLIIRYDKLKANG